MIDLHCHLLPGIDDGAMTLEDATAMARHAEQSGITHAVLTPHLHPGRYENYSHEIEKARDSFQQHLTENDIALKLGFAAEVRISPEIMFWVEQDKIAYLGEYDGYKVMLLEFPHNQISPGWDNLFRWLLSKNIRPMVAHPERNKELMASPEKVLPLFNAGALFQLTAGAVAGLFGVAAQNTAKYILDHDIATIIASDAHNLKHRPPELEHGRRQIEEWFNESLSWEMALNRPRAISSIQFE